MEKDIKISKKQPISREELIKIIAKQLLKEIGIKTHILGFKYWTTALAIMIENEMTQDERMPMMELYRLTAKKHKTTAAKVERAMRYTYSEIDLKQYFKTNYPINNTALLFLLKEEILNKM